MSDPVPQPVGDPELCSPEDDASADSRSLLDVWGLRIDRDYDAPVRMWQTALMIALSAGERSSHGR